MHFSSEAKKSILTAISTTLVSARTRTMSKNVKRFLLVGRVVRKKLTRATQQKLEAVKESRQRSKIIGYLVQSLSSTKELSWCLQVLWLLWFFSLFWPGLSTLASCFSCTTSLSGSLISNGRFGPNLGILSDLLSCSQERICSGVVEYCRIVVK